jgi:uncharacterized membrane-anchored protein
VDPRTKELCRRLRRGEIAVIDHADLDPTAARALIELGPAAVINAAASITGRYPNTGPQMLLEAGVPLIDGVGKAAFAHMREGQSVEVRGDSVWAGEQLLARGERLTPAAVAERMEAARRNLGEELRRFSENTLEYLAAESVEAFADLPLPELRTRMQGRPVLIVARGDGFKEDLAAARPFIEEQQPVLIAVDGGADALLETGYRPHMIVGDMDSASDGALRCGAELVVHTYRDGRPSPGLERIRTLGLDARPVAAPGTSEDVAMLLAYQNGAELIVAVGTHFSMVEFLDKRRPGMASTFLTRLKVGSILVDAKGLSRLYRPALGMGPLLALIGSGLLFLLVLVIHSPAVQHWLTIVSMGVEIWLRRHGMR